MNSESNSTLSDLDALVSTVRQNCHLTDAHHARDYSLCIYLLKMRELYRWEMQLPYSASLSKESVGEWLVTREGLWETIEEETYRPLLIEGVECAPFEEQAINQRLASASLSYGAGLGLYGKPSFFLADLEQCYQEDGISITITGREYARDLTAYPALSRGTAITIRRESMARMIWERIEEWRWQKRQGAMAAAIACYPFDDNFDLALAQLTEKETLSAIYHERGEIEAGGILGTDWAVMLSNGGGRRRELLARAVRDHLADSLVTLPRLLEATDPAPLHFWFANLSGIRKTLIPELIDAYRAWLDGRPIAILERQVTRERDRWLAVTGEMLAGEIALADDPTWLELEARFLGE